MSPVEVAEPLFRVVRGTPTDEELAAVVVVLASRPRAAATSGPPPRTGWSAYAHGARRPLSPGPHAWRLSARG